jgi:hypothetical protein
MRLSNDASVEPNFFFVRFSRLDPWDSFRCPKNQSERLQACPTCGSVILLCRLRFLTKERDANSSLSGIWAAVWSFLLLDLFALCQLIAMNPWLEPALELAYSWKGFAFLVFKELWVKNLILYQYTKRRKVLRYRVNDWWRTFKVRPEIVSCILRYIYIYIQNILKMHDMIALFWWIWMPHALWSLVPCGRITLQIQWLWIQHTVY